MITKEWQTTYFDPVLNKGTEFKYLDTYLIQEVLLLTPPTMRYDAFLRLHCRKFAAIVQPFICIS